MKRRSFFKVAAANAAAICFSPNVLSLFCFDKALTKPDTSQVLTESAIQKLISTSPDAIYFDIKSCDTYLWRGELKQWEKLHGL